jgi:hypothetical protein
MQLCLPARAGVCGGGTGSGLAGVRVSVAYSHAKRAALPILRRRARGKGGRRPPYIPPAFLEKPPENPAPIKLTGRCGVSPQKGVCRRPERAEARGKAFPRMMLGNEGSLFPDG